MQHLTPLILCRYTVISGTPEKILEHFLETMRMDVHHSEPGNQRKLLYEVNGHSTFSTSLPLKYCITVEPALLWHHVVRYEYEALTHFLTISNLKVCTHRVSTCLPSTQSLKLKLKTQTAYYSRDSTGMM